MRAVSLASALALALGLAMMASVPSAAGVSAPAEKTSATGTKSDTVAQPAKEAPPAKELPASTPQGRTPFQVFAAIERAWSKGLVDSIVTFLPVEDVSLQLGKASPAKAFYSHDQAAYMLRDALGFTVTESFQFVEFKNEKAGEEPPYAVAEWTFRREPAGQLIVQKVRIELKKAPGCLVVSEIRVED
jgi:hypothetical protein